MWQFKTIYILFPLYILIDSDVVNFQGSFFIIPSVQPVVSALPKALHSSGNETSVPRLVSIAIGTSICEEVASDGIVQDEMELKEYD